LNNPIGYVTLDGRNLERLIDKVEDAIVGEPINEICAALTFLMVSLQHPDEEGPKIAEAVKGISEWLTLFMDKTPPKKEMN
jgi:hypothetical protein